MFVCVCVCARALSRAVCVRVSDVCKYCRKLLSMIQIILSACPFMAKSRKCNTIVVFHHALIFTELEEPEKKSWKMLQQIRYAVLICSFLFPPQKSEKCKKPLYCQNTQTVKRNLF